MSGRQQQIAVYTGLRGRDGHEQAEIDIPGDKARECINVDFFRTSYARKRGGCLSMRLDGSGMTGFISAMHRHVAGADDKLAELWIVDDAPIINPAPPATGGPHLARLYPHGQDDAQPAWVEMAWKTPVTGPTWAISWVSFNGKLYILADSNVDRLQVFDPAHSQTTLRFAGLETPATPDAYDDGVGTYARVKRWYRVIYTVQRDGITVRRSLASPAKEFLPSGTSLRAIVQLMPEPTIPPAANQDRPAVDGETHWEVYGSETLEGPYYWLGTTSATLGEPEGTSGGYFFYDTVNPIDYWKSDRLMPLQGDNEMPWSARLGITDDNRLLLAGANEAGHSQNEVWFSPVLGSTSPLFHDDERFPATNKISFNEQDSSYITAFGGPIGSTVLVFKNTQTWRLMPTGDESDPYRRRAISKTVGCLHQRTVVSAEDETGIPTVYWLSEQGPYRFNLAQGLARLTWDIQDIWDRVNINGASIIAHGISHPDKHQIWWWLALDTETAPANMKIVYDTHLGRVIDAGLVRDGWSTHDGASAHARCSVMFSETWDGFGVSRNLKPYIGQSYGLNGFKPMLWLCDLDRTHTDVNFPFQAYVLQPQRHLAGLSNRCQLGHPAVLGSVGLHGEPAEEPLPGELPKPGGEFSLNHTRDYGARFGQDPESFRSALVSMKANGLETRVLRVAEGIENADVSSVALAVGDRNPVVSTWVVDALFQPFEVREPVVA